MSATKTPFEEVKRLTGATKLRVAAFRKASLKSKPKLMDEGRQGRNFLFGAPAKEEGLAFVEKYFAKAIEKPHTELAAITIAWRACAPDYAKDTVALVSFKRGVLEVNAPSAAVKYRLEMDLRTGLEQRLRATHKGDVLKKVKVSIGMRATASKTDAQQAHVEDERQIQLSRILTAAEKGEL